MLKILRSVKENDWANGVLGHIGYLLKIVTKLDPITCRVEE